MGKIALNIGKFLNAYILHIGGLILIIIGVSQGSTRAGIILLITGIWVGIFGILIRHIRKTLSTK